MFKNVFALWMVMATATVANADLVYNLRFDNTAFSLDAGQSTVLSIFFDEIYTPPDLPRLDLTTDPLPTRGLTTANFQVAVSGTGTSTITAATGNNLFDGFGGPTVVVGNPTTIVQDIDLLSDPVFATETLNVRSIQVGTITVTAGGNPGDQNVFNLQDIFAGSDFVIEDGLGGFSADAVLNYGSATLTVTNLAAVPEPTTWGLLALLSAGGIYRHRKRQKANAAAAIH